MAKEIRLNRLVLSELPKLYNFESFEGNDAFSIFSSGEVISIIAKYSEQLGIDRNICDGSELPKALSSALSSADSSIRLTAEEITLDLGRRLGLIFYVLTRDPSITIKANPRYSEIDFKLWTYMRHVILVGGLANGDLGISLAKNAENILRELGYENLSISVGPFPSHTQLIGASRLADTENGNAAIFDFGHTFVKTAVAHFTNRTLDSLKLLPKVHSEYMGKGFASAEEELREAEMLHGYIVKVIKDVFTIANRTLSSNIVISIANNAIGGKIGYGGCYYKLMLLADNYADYLAITLSAELKRDIHVTLLHDGRAAALCFEEKENTAAVALGTAFGVGYTEGQSELMNISDSLEISLL